MRVAIFGTKSEPQYLANQLKYIESMEIEFFVDNDVEKQGTTLLGYNVVSFGTLCELSPEKVDAVIVAVRGKISMGIILEQLKNAQIVNVGIFRFSYHDYKKNIRTDEDISDAILWLKDINKPILPYLECNIVDSCNLKCKGCTHFSNIMKNETEIELKELVKDLAKISQKVEIVRLRLLGGEPLLHPDLEIIVRKSREIFPKADISIVTNGLLIPKIRDSLLLAMKENNVGFYISRYQPTALLSDKIETKLHSFGIDYYYVPSEPIKQFSRALSMQGNSDTVLAQKNCLSPGCRFLRHGKLYKCPTEGLIEYFASEYGFDEIHDISRGIDIYDDNINWDTQLIKYLHEPVEMCRYCAESREVFDWKVETMPQKEDWIVGGLFV